LQSIIVKYVDYNQFVAMASLELSRAFYIVINLLIKSHKMVGIPDDVVDLIGIWLTGRSFI
jgi:hypothetical protein